MGGGEGPQQWGPLILGGSSHTLWLFPDSPHADRHGLPFLHPLFGSELEREPLLHPDVEDAE